MIYKQSIKGKQLLETNTANLPQKIRNLLTLIDGESSVDQIQVLFGQENITMLLRSLVSLGLIEELDDNQIPKSIANFHSTAPAKTNDGLDRFRDLSGTSSNQELNAKFPPIAPASNTCSDESDFKAQYGASVIGLVDSLRDSSDLAAFELMFSLEKCSSVNQLRLLLPHVVKLANRTPQNEEKIKKVLELIN